eukprot:m.450962 g.450962  ORF g.450962 m.450962 type:complete len:146 (-) comp20322_c0_seq33:643-1080(-)
MLSSPSKATAYVPSDPHERLLVTIGKAFSDWSAGDQDAVNVIRSLKQMLDSPLAETPKSLLRKRKRPDEGAPKHGRNLTVRTYRRLDGEVVPVTTYNELQIGKAQQLADPLERGRQASRVAADEQAARAAEGHDVFVFVPNDRSN